MTVDRRPSRISFSPGIIEQVAKPHAERMAIQRIKEQLTPINPYDAEYHALLHTILNYGVDSDDRTGVGTRKIFGYQMRFDLSNGDFPNLTTKKIVTRSLIHELIWFLKGETNIKYLKDNNVGIWDDWADEEGELGPVYGYQWRSWPDYDGGAVDQIQNTVKALKENPYSRRHIVTAWNPAMVDQMALPPCHLLFQFQVAEGKLSSQLYQRSGDVFLGVPFNIASYALLTKMMAQVAGYEAGDFVHTLGDAHLYKNHFEQAREQLSRTPFPPPQMIINPNVENIDDFKFEDFVLVNYQHHPFIKAPIAV